MAFSKFAVSHEQIRTYRGRLANNRQEIYSVLADYLGERCCKCASQNTLEIDHVVPLTVGGSNNYGNLQLLCKSCNCSKNNGIADYRTREQKAALDSLDDDKNFVTVYYISDSRGVRLISAHATKTSVGWCFEVKQGAFGERVVPFYLHPIGETPEEAVSKYESQLNYRIKAAKETLAGWQANH